MITHTSPDMLIEFTVGNYLSIKDRQTLRMDATSISEHKDQLIDTGRYQLLRSAVIYGANASGKSNFLSAMSSVYWIIKTSGNQSSTSNIGVSPFLLSTTTEHAPSYFEVLFLIGDIRYRYGFEADKKTIHTEWLYAARKEKEKPLFVRQNFNIEVLKDFKEGNGLEERTRNNALFLAVCDQFNGKITRSIFQWLDNWWSVSGIYHSNYRKELFDLFDLPDMKKDLIKIIKSFNLGFSDIELRKKSLDVDSLINFSEDQEEFSKLLDSRSTVGLSTVHNKYNEFNNIVDSIFFELNDNESAGTNKIFDLLAPIYLTIVYGGIFIVDELDAKLHPLMTQAIVRLFNNPASNPNNAQLIFATHDTNLLTHGGFRRDQIYFTEKDQYGATCLYSLVEYQEENGDKVRKDRSFEKDYIQGRYGAIPFIGDLSKLVAWHEK